ncbi:MAG TPA: 3-phosphoshikimate 1-carboxyvinyltransferase, partial [Candidatus Limnocylindrales bacterium]|nr:3-phosphoshikimate 1-carboxyvinyltransferase [Candidatus Limnocylindrales bacterium]
HDANAAMTTTSTDAAVIRPAARLRGELSLPGDKSVSHRALMFATLAAGESRIDGAGDGADVRSTAGVCRALGAMVERVDAAQPGRSTSATVDYLVNSPGVDGLREPAANLDCGNSGTSLRLFAGILAGLPFRSVLDGDDSLRRRPVARIIEPLRAMGATLLARSDDSLPPLTVIGRHPLHAVDRWTPVPSAQVKSAILLAALRAEGRTTVREAVATRDHTERMLRARGIGVTTERLAPVDADGRRGAVAVSLEGGRTMTAIDERVPGDVSAAAFWLVAAAIHPDADLVVRGVGVNPTRRAVIDLLRAMGADIEETAVAGRRATPASPSEEGVGEPLADLRVRSSALRAIELGPDDVAAAIDEIPILCLAAAHAEGTTTIRGADELRHKESDRIRGTTDGLRALGVDMTVDGDDLRIHGGRPLAGTTVDSLDDHRLAMTFAIAGLLAAGRTTVLRPGSASISYPGFFDDLGRVGS